MCFNSCTAPGVPSLPTETSFISVSSCVFSSFREMADYVAASSTGQVRGRGL